MTANNKIFINALIYTNLVIDNYLPEPYTHDNLFSMWLYKNKSYKMLEELLKCPLLDITSTSFIGNTIYDVLKDDDFDIYQPLFDKYIK